MTYGGDVLRRWRDTECNQHDMLRPREVVLVAMNCTEANVHAGGLDETEAGKMAGGVAAFAACIALGVIVERLVLAVAGAAEAVPAVYAPVER